MNAETGALELDDLGRVMSSRTKLVAFTHASNILGTIHPVAEITRFVHDRGARVCVDGVAYAPHRAVDVRAWDVDYYVLSLYKVYRPASCATLRQIRAAAGARRISIITSSQRIAFGTASARQSQLRVVIRRDWHRGLPGRAGGESGRALKARRRERESKGVAAIADHERTSAIDC